MVSIYNKILSKNFDQLQIENEAGVWVKLSPKAISDLRCDPDCPEAYALAVSKEKNLQFLEECEVSSV